MSVFSPSSSEIDLGDEMISESKVFFHDLKKINADRLSRRLDSRRRDGRPLGKGKGPEAAMGGRASHRLQDCR